MVPRDPYADDVRLLEREDELERLRAAVHEAVSGQGVGYAIVGEAGAGKSALVDAVSAEAHGLRVLRGHCDPLHTPRPLGPFRGLGLDGLSTTGAEASRLSELCDRVFADLCTQPTLLIVEDLHWLDAVSADLLRFLARRIETAPLALFVTYRDLEIDAHHPVRPLLGDFASLDGLRTLQLRPLTIEAVTELVAGTTLDAGRVHTVTGGNPFFVSAVVREPDLPMPGSVRDAVLSKVVEVDSGDLEVLQLVATAPDGLDDRVLPALGVDLPTLRRLDATALLTRTSDSLAFRHELGRLAVLSTVPPGGAPVLHARLLDGLERLEPPDPAVLTHHAVGARDSVRALLHARAAAAEAVAAASNTEAAAFLETALTHLPTTAPPLDRAALLAQLSHQQYLTSRLAEASASARASIPLWEQVGALAGVAEAHAGLAVFEYQLGRRRQCDEHAAKACEIAETTGEPATIARVHTDAAILAWIGSDLPRAAACAARTLEVATEAGLDEFVVAGRMMADAVSWVSGETGARTRLLQWTEAAREGGWDELAWRGYVILVITDMEQGNLRGAQLLIEETLSFVTERDLSVARNWHISFRGMLHLLMGRWSAAQEDSEAALGAATLGMTQPHVVLGLLALRRGEGDGSAHLDDALSMARGADEPLRYLSAYAALAEAAWMTGREDPRVFHDAAGRVAELGATPDTRWAVGNLLVWLRRLGLDVDVPDVAEPFRLQLDGRHADAASWWRLAGDPFLEAMAYADSTDPAHRVTAVTLLDKAGAVGTADRLRVELRQDGLTMVPQRPRESTRANPGGLTNRQLDVARLVARGHTNAEIADRLFISPKTADHHVSAILAKLDLPNRRAVAVNAAELGLD